MTRANRKRVESIAVTICGAENLFSHEDRLLTSLQHDVLEAVARGRPLKPLLAKLCRRVEELAPGVICSILSVDNERRLQTLAGPSLPRHYCDAIDGLSIGPSTGSCGAAAWRGEPMEVTDIATDPLWADYRALALPLGLRACWSSPIKGADARVLGTFAFYYGEPRGPNDRERYIVETCTNLCSIALEQDETRRRLHRIAYYDSVTGLPNRVAFQQRVAETIGAPAQAGCETALFSIDLDDFKRVNDTLGHLAGDELLAQVAKRLSAELAPDEMVARIGGDEFAVMQPHVRTHAGIALLAQRLLDALAKPFEIAGESIQIGGSIGIARAPTDGPDLTALLKCADVALYDAKGAGRGQYRLFDPAVFERELKRRETERDLREALDRDQFEVHYQPFVDLKSSKTIGFEALVRWNHPRRGLLPPLEFIALAEKAGLIVELGALVLRKACAEAAHWPSEMRIAVNLSPLQLQSPGFALSVLQTLARSGLAPRRLELEITETVLLSDNPATRNALDDLKHLGVAIAIDDFGTGYSALSYLRAFPIDRIKIDRSFVSDIHARQDARSIIRAVLGLAGDLGIQTTAEGIETVRQLAWLREAGCDDAQGYLFSKPRAASDLAGFFEKESPNRRQRAR